MLAQLTTLKLRLAIADIDTTNDALLTRTIEAVSARFDRECRRTLARTADATHEFSPADAELLPACYPIEAVTKWEAKATEAEGWVEQPAPDYVIRSGCVVSLRLAFGAQLSTVNAQLARITYTGGYVLPGAAPAPGQTPLPAELEQAAVEQVAYWFQNRDRLGLARAWEYHGLYRQFADLDLLASVRAVLGAYRRWAA